MKSDKIYVISIWPTSISKKYAIELKFAWEPTAADLCEALCYSKERARAELAVEEANRDPDDDDSVMEDIKDELLAAIDQSLQLLRHVGDPLFKSESQTTREVSVAGTKVGVISVRFEEIFLARKEKSLTF